MACCHRRSHHLSFQRPRLRARVPISQVYRTDFLFNSQILARHGTSTVLSPLEHAHHNHTSQGGEKMRSGRPRLLVYWLGSVLVLTLPCVPWSQQWPLELPIKPVLS